MKKIFHPMCLFALIVFALTGRSQAEGVLGKTVKGSYSLTKCFQKSSCSTGQPLSFAFYVSTRGRVFDLIGGQQIYEEGKPSDQGLKFSVNGNTVRMGKPGTGVDLTYRITGNTCSASWAFNDPTSKYTTNTLSCSVTDGPPN